MRFYKNIMQLTHHIFKKCSPWWGYGKIGEKHGFMLEELLFKVNEPVMVCQNIILYISMFLFCR